MSNSCTSDCRTHSDLLNLHGVENSLFLLFVLGLYILYLFGPKCINLLQLNRHLLVENDCRSTGMIALECNSFAIFLTGLLSSILKVPIQQVSHIDKCYTFFKSRGQFQVQVPRMAK